MTKDMLDLKDKIKNIKKGSLVSIASYYGAKEELMYDLIEDLLKENKRIYMYSMLFKKDVLCKHILFTKPSLTGIDDENRAKIYDIYKSLENKEVYIKDEDDLLTTEDLEKDIEKIKPDYIFIGPFMGEYPQKVEIIEHLKQIAKKYENIVFALLKLETGYDNRKNKEHKELALKLGIKPMQEEQTSLKDVDENGKCFELSDVVILIEDKIAGEYKFTIEKGSL